jgi:hypothetical protein
LSEVETTPAPFLIVVAHPDGTESEIPAAGYEELGTLLGRMTATCADGRRPTPPTVIWRLDRDGPRPLNTAELEEGGLPDLPILAG